MTVDEIATVNNIKHAWQFLLQNIDYPIGWQYVAEYNRIVGEGLVRDAGMLRAFGVRIGGVERTSTSSVLICLTGLSWSAGQQVSARWSWWMSII